MADFKRMHMLVSVDVMPQGLNLFCSISPDNIGQWERSTYPHSYTHVSNACTWIIYSNAELTIKMCAVMTEYADKSCAEATAKNNKRKLANR